MVVLREPQMILIRELWKMSSSPRYEIPVLQPPHFSLMNRLIPLWRRKTVWMTATMRWTSRPLAGLAALKKDPASPVFILADAKDADMAFGITSPGRNHDGRLRSVAEYRDQMRAVVSQGLVDIMLMSASTSEILTIQERIFDASAVTPAVRANDTTDIHICRGSRYLEVPSRPFSSATIDHIQAGKSPCSEVERRLGSNLGLYSVTFNNDPAGDLDVMEKYKAFRLEAEEKHFGHFLEVFHPNVPAKVHGIAPEQIPYFVNDHIVRLLAGVRSEEHTSE